MQHIQFSRLLSELHKFTPDGKRKRSNGMISFWYCRRSSSSLSTARSGKFYCQTHWSIEHVYIVDLFISENVLWMRARWITAAHRQLLCSQLYIYCVRAKATLFRWNRCLRWAAENVGFAKLFQLSTSFLAGLMIAWPTFFNSTICQRHSIYAPCTTLYTVHAIRLHYISF